MNRRETIAALVAGGLARPQHEPACQHEKRKELDAYLTRKAQIWLVQPEATVTVDDCPHCSCQRFMLRYPGESMSLGSDFGSAKSGLLALRNVVRARLASIQGGP